ncbi:hypothetical protein [Haloarcula mannanilytica]
MSPMSTNGDVVSAGLIVCGVRTLLLEIKHGEYRPIRT